MAPMIGDERGKYWHTGQTSRGNPIRESSEPDARAKGTLAGQRARETETDIRAGEIIAARCWILFNESLYSMTVPYRWYPGAINEAGTKSPDSDHFLNSGGSIFVDYETFVPETEGFYAFKTMQLCCSEYDYYSDFFIVRGTVALWGTVLEHELGYRAQFAKIRSLDSMAIRTDNVVDRILRRPELAKLRRKYGVQ